MSFFSYFINENQLVKLSMWSDSRLQLPISPELTGTLDCFRRFCRCFLDFCRFSRVFWLLQELRRVGDVRADPDRCRDLRGNARGRPIFVKISRNPPILLFPPNEVLFQGRVLRSTNLLIIFQLKSYHCRSILAVATTPGGGRLERSTVDEGWSR